MNRRHGFSLLELVLAIGLSVALVALLGLAINLHLVKLDSSRTTVEQAQLARSVLDLIAADLRATTMAPSQDVSEQLAVAEEAAQYNVDEVDQEAEDPESAANDASETPIPGVNGTATTLTVDRRLMRQSLQASTTGGAPVPLADAGWSQVAYGMSMNAAAPGLVRTATTYNNAVWQVEQGQAAVVADLIAAEVLGVEFAYFNGSEFAQVWEMEEEQALPLAVEVSIEVAAADADNLNAPIERRTPRTYRRIVYLPAGSEEPSESDSGSGGSGGSSATGSSGEL